MGVTNRTHSTRLRARLYPDIPRPDAPVIYTGAFPILTAWPESICYNNNDDDCDDGNKNNNNAVDIDNNYDDDNNKDDDFDGDNCHNDDHDDL